MPLAPSLPPHGCMCAGSSWPRPAARAAAAVGLTICFVLQCESLSDVFFCQKMCLNLTEKYIFERRYSGIPFGGLKKSKNLVQRV